MVPDLSARRVGICGRKSSLTKFTKNRIFKANNETKGRATVSELSETIAVRFKKKIPKTTLWRYTKTLGMIYRRSYIKPKLKLQHKIDRLSFILEKIKPKGSFEEGKWTIHVDEKWFYIVRKSGKIRITPNAPRIDDFSCQHKSHIEKVMFLSALAKPQKRPDGTFFDGKIGIFRFTQLVPYLRNYKEHKKGDLREESVSVSAEEYYNMMVKPGGVFAAIQAKMGFAPKTGVIIQQDGASPHTGKENLTLLNLAGKDLPVKIKFVTQPAQSPDLNKNDLSFFHSLQRLSDSLRFRHPNTSSLMNAVETAYRDYPRETLERIDALQFQIYREILRDNGGNQYKLPHSGIRNRQNYGLHVVDLKVDKELELSARQELSRLLTIQANYKEQHEND